MTRKKQAQCLCYGFLLAILFAFVGCDDLLHPENPETPSVPAAPTGLVAEAVSPTSIRVSWTAVPDATQYEVYDEINSHTTITTYTSLVISELKEDTDYHFTVKAGNATGWSVPSDSVSAKTPLSATIPAPPSSVIATALSTSEIIVSWQPPGGATKYQVHDGTKDYETDNTYYTVQGLSENTAYQFTVKAGNDAGWSGASTPPASATTLSSTPGGTAPAAPEGVTATALASGEVLVTWTAVTGAESYIVSYGTAQNAITLFGAQSSENSATVSGLSPHTAYYFSVKAGNDSGWSAVSAPASVTTVAAPEAPEPPAVPQNITALVLSENSISLSWDSVTGAVSYVVYRSRTESSGYAGVETSNTAAYTDTGLSASTVYYYKIRALGSGGLEGTLSDAVSATTLAAGSEGIPPAPQGLSAAALSASSIGLNWNAASGAASYKIYRSGSEDGTYVAIGTSATTSYANTNLGASTSFYYKVSALNSGGGEGPQSATVSATTLAVPPEAPQGLNAAALSSSSIRLTWNTVAKAGSYKIYRSGTADGDYADIGNSDVTNYTDTDLAAVTAYYYKVSAVDSYGTESALSAEATATTPALPPETPLNVTAEASAPGSITISWQRAAGAAYYRIYRADSDAGPFTGIDSSVTAGYTDIGLNPSTAYYYKVSSINDDGVESVQSPAIFATTDSQAGGRLVPHTNIEDALTWLTANVVSNGSYIVRLDTNSSIAPKTLSYSSKKNITITLMGSGGTRIISPKNSNGALFTVSSGVTLILDDRITMNGRTLHSLVAVWGTLVLNEGAKITGNTNGSFNDGGGVSVNSAGTFIMNGGEISGNTTGSTTGYGGGVHVNFGTFTMNGGEISGNIASGGGGSGNGGGVYVSSGAFTMNGGKITGNIARRTSGGSPSAYGGGVYVDSNATFTMNGGDISENTVSTASSSTSSSTYGGGVYVASKATFIMANGTIAGNTATVTATNGSSYGGGVYVDNSPGSFTMNGGTISGNTAVYGGGVSASATGIFSKAEVGGIIYGSDGGANKNTATGGDTRGHAAYVVGSGKKRNSTAGALVGMDSTTSGSAGGWE